MPGLNRSKSGRHALKPAMRTAEPMLDLLVGHESQLYSRIRWTFGRGSVIRTIWKSVVLHTLFAIVIVTVTMTTSFELAIPAVMLTVLGVVLGFVISYRADMCDSAQTLTCSYDRYWMGRTAWTPRTAEERATGEWRRPEQELLEVMAEKKIALDLIEGYSVAVKHHLRGEPGLYYEDLYDLLKPLQPHFILFSTSNPTLHNKSSVATLDVPVMTVTAASPSSPTPPEHTVLGHEDEQHSDIDSDYEVDNMGVDHQGPWKTVPHAALRGSFNYRTNVGGDGDNLPLEILRCLSEWCSVLEDRGTVPGTSMGAIMGCIASFEDSLSGDTVWIFLIFLPFQLVGMFGWHSIGGTLIASFIYLGFLAAGEEIEQPFGMRFALDRGSNDLDLDLFCRAIIHVDIQQLQHVSCLNAYVPPRQKAKMKHRSGTVTEATSVHPSFVDKL
ncbi:hypothetical protein BT96DRAFT_916745 [Gymnopus androsaceus JB14]|uniref:Uncharacterized protein n=1 Tax=Gymnopus androsaceus JB14 TaxID=1447944 RepID=A0A6A4I753_9AGAR|nr:hypothetical protein BT96DRAFT_916745 [Gymnopus androsaceus JB14]